MRELTMQHDEQCDVAGVLSERSEDRDQDEARHHQQQIHEPHQPPIAPAAEVAGDRTDGGCDTRRDHRHARADEHRLLHAAQGLGQQVLAQRVGAEPVFGARRVLQGIEVEFGVRPRQQWRQRVAPDEQQDQDHQRGHGRAVAREPAQHQRPPGGERLSGFWPGDLDFGHATRTLGSRNA
jgi:hypothetical protein